VNCFSQFLKSQLFRDDKQSLISRTPYPPIGGEHAVIGAQIQLSQGPKIQSRRHLAPKESFDPQMEYEAVEISEVGRPFERKVLLHFSCFGLL